MLGPSPPMPFVCFGPIPLPHTVQSNQPDGKAAVPRWAGCCNVLHFTCMFLPVSSKGLHALNLLHQHLLHHHSSSSKDGKETALSISHFKAGCLSHASQCTVSVRGASSLALPRGNVGQRQCKQLAHRSHRDAQVSQVTKETSHFMGAV